MALVHINRFPFFRDFDAVLRDFSMPFDSDDAVNPLVPSADVVELDKAVEFHLDMPGVKPEDIEVKLQGDVLSIRGTRQRDQKEEGRGWVRQERSVGTFARSFTLPPTLDGATPEATYRHGVLVVRVPKKEEVQPRSVKVKVDA